MDLEMDTTRSNGRNEMVFFIYLLVLQLPMELIFLSAGIQEGFVCRTKGLGTFLSAISESQLMLDMLKSGHFSFAHFSSLSFECLTMSISLHEPLLYLIW
ncbi:hypothetical protein HAX54_026418 [Datura stramonium]|uniref:Uncharacterized protein n=1 Tax=Datura stramonium TaxID=4076 RepID=A0ABS8S7T3_DATST|nr:hypothetical protein [Datura stramonium]